MVPDQITLTFPCSTVEIVQLHDLLSQLVTMALQAAGLYIVWHSPTYFFIQAALCVDQQAVTVL